MNYQSLQGLSAKDLLPVFNEAFSDYILPMPPMSQGTFDWKLLRDGVDLRYSPGCFGEDHDLQGFMLHAPGRWENMTCIYNAGTGIIPSARGKQASKEMYRYIMPQLVEAGFEYCLLECIVGNNRALKLYQGQGFQILRDLVCFQGKLKALDLQDLEVVKHEQEIPWERWSNWWHHPPSWQNGIPAVMRVAHTFQFLEFYRKDVPVAYAVFKPGNAYLAQFAVDPAYRLQKIGSQVFAYLQSLSEKPVTMVNIDERDAASLSFLKHLGFRETVRQFELGRPC